MEQQYRQPNQSGYIQFMNTQPSKTQPKISQEEQICRGPFKFIRRHNNQLIYKKPTRWKNHELMKFALFIKFAALKNLKSNPLSSWVFYEGMAYFLQTRNANQCRIYHRRALKTQSQAEILASIETQFPDFEQQLYKATPTLEKIWQRLQLKENEVDCINVAFTNKHPQQTCSELQLLERHEDEIKLQHIWAQGNYYFSKWVAKVEKLMQKYPSQNAL